MSATTEYTPELIERFYSKVSKIPTEAGCLEWMAFHNAKGYGYFKVGKNNIRAHRFAWEIVNGPIPAGLVIRHMCNNRLCCNPAHLEPGTMADNIHDMIRAGRFQNAPNTNTPYVRPVVPPKEERFYAQVSKTPTDTGCLEWLGTCSPGGYGKFSGGWFAHRFAWEAVNGPIPEGMVIAHHCDNPRCCRIEHLFCCTRADNMRDMDNKGRRVRITVLAQDQVMEIRSGEFSNWSTRKIARHFGISKSQAHRILKRENWAHI